MTRNHPHDFLKSQFFNVLKSEFCLSSLITNQNFGSPKIGKGCWVRDDKQGNS